ncbi:hypothetical protein EJ08DRAFT_648785 [Tothia fuscella]|uniref:DUF6594 domain-containing protein n=1 Tax=Tothia fuscella TaxID=1048955 RepID=A0A9P4NUD1_9PEZI|nr:hypothetical protein EJ08DRAFT_648785 [Tothia fuscella]
MASLLPSHEKRPLSVSKSPTSEEVARPRGFAELAFLISTDQDFSIFRRFDELGARSLLRMQAQLVQYEQQLRVMELGRSDGEERLDGVLDQVEVLIKRYHKAILRQHQIHKLSTPNRPTVNKIDNWLQNATEGRPVGEILIEDYEPIAEDNSTHYWRTRDYALLKSPTYKDTWTEMWTRKYLGRLLHEERPVPPEWSGYYFDRSKVERIKDYLAFPVAVVFLVVPAFLFHFICDGSKRLGILLGFIIGLALAIQIFMGTGRKETLGSALAYTGVMGLLLSNGTASKCKTS